MDTKNPVDLIAMILIVIGAINWGFVGAFDINLFSLIFGSIPLLLKAVHILFGVAGLYGIYSVWLKK